MDPIVNISALLKLADYVASGIGSVAGPMLARWRAEREVQAKLIAAKGEADASKIKAEGVVDALQLISNATLEARKMMMSQDTAVRNSIDISEMVTESMKYQGEKRLKNIQSVVKLAAMDLGEKDVPDIEPDHDFTSKIF